MAYKPGKTDIKILDLLSSKSNLREEDYPAIVRRNLDEMAYKLFNRKWQNNSEFTEWLKFNIKTKDMEEDEVHYERLLAIARNGEDRDSMAAIKMIEEKKLAEEVEDTGDIKDLIMKKLTGMILGRNKSDIKWAIGMIAKLSEGDDKNNDDFFNQMNDIFKKKESK